MNMILTHRPASILFPSTFVLVMNSLGCLSEITPIESSSIATTHEALTSTDPGPNDFRNAFYTYASLSGYSEEDVAHMLYVPTPDLDTVGQCDHGNPNDCFGSIKETLAQKKPSALYQFGTQTPLVRISEPDAVFEDNGPVTLLLFPGYYQEFFPLSWRMLLSENDSSFHRQWKDALLRAAPEDLADESYDIQKLGTKPVPLSELFRMGSIDDASGKPLVKLMLLLPPAGSGETVGNEVHCRAAYLRRLDKLFHILPSPERMYMLGYSRGIPVGLDVYASALENKAAHPWASTIAGAVSLGGTVYGTPMADMAFDRKTPLGGLTGSIIDIANNLESCDPKESPFARATKIARNTRAWATWAPRLALQLGTSSTPEGYRLEGLGAGQADPLGVWNFVSNIVFRYMFQADRFFSGYCDNVEQWKTGVRLVTDGIRMMSTEARLAWFQTHALPSHFKAFSIAATMGDSTTTKDSVWALSKDPVVYGANDSLDYMILRGGFYQGVSVGTGDLNDGMVPVSHAVFWPGLHTSLRPSQPRYKTYLMGILANHHWGLAYDSVFPRADTEHNRMPKDVLLRSIARFIVQVDSK